MTSGVRRQNSVTDAHNGRGLRCQCSRLGSQRNGLGCQRKRLRLRRTILFLAPSQSHSANIRRSVVPSLIVQGRNLAIIIKRSDAAVIIKSGRAAVIIKRDGAAQEAAEDARQLISILLALQLPSAAPTAE